MKPYEGKMKAALQTLAGSRKYLTDMLAGCARATVHCQVGARRAVHEVSKPRMFSNYCICHSSFFIGRSCFECEAVSNVLLPVRCCWACVGLRVQGGDGPVLQAPRRLEGGLRTASPAQCHGRGIPARPESRLDQSKLRPGSPVTDQPRLRPDIVVTFVFRLGCEGMSGQALIQNPPLPFAD